MTSDVAHRRGWQIFEVVFGVPLLAALALQAVVPLSFSLGGFAPVGMLGGGILAVAGVVLVALTRRQLAQTDQPTEPGRPPQPPCGPRHFSVSLAIHSISGASPSWLEALWHSTSHGCGPCSSLPSLAVTSSWWRRKNAILRPGSGTSTWPTRRVSVDGSVGSEANRDADLEPDRVRRVWVRRGSTLPSQHQLQSQQALRDGANERIVRCPRPC